MGSFEISEGNITEKGKKKKPDPQNTCLTATASREVAQMLVSATSKQGLVKEAHWTLVLRVRTRPECPEDHRRELTMR